MCSSKQSSVRGARYLDSFHALKFHQSRISHSLTRMSTDLKPKTNCLQVFCIIRVYPRRSAADYFLLVLT